MATRKLTARRLQARPRSTADGGRVIHWVPTETPAERPNLRSIPMYGKNASRGNRYICALERNQNGKYNVRMRVLFGSGAGGREGQTPGEGAAGWNVPVYFLASSFNAAMKKLEESLQFLQRNEARLRFWGLERTDDPNVAGELLQEFGLSLDRRRDFPRKAAEISAISERPVSASALASVRRVLADSLAQERPAGHPALASD